MSKISKLDSCPYSNPPYGQFTDDHVFPRFLGGRRTVRICRDCNSRFGHSFEASASRQLKRLQVFISHFGLDLSSSPATWPGALIIGEKTYDLISGPEGVQYQLSHPVIVRDEEGRIVSGQARSRTEANRLVRDLVASGKATEIKIDEKPGKIIEDIKLDTIFAIDANMFRFATKLATATMISFGYGDYIGTSGIPAYLRGECDWETRIAFLDLNAIHGLRLPLSHAVYLELGNPSHAVVLTFGINPIYVPLPSAERGAFLATLDPISGNESFVEVESVGLVAPPTHISKERAISHFQHMLDTLGREASARGAKRPPSLQLGEVEFGQEVPLVWFDSTHRFLKTL